MNHPLAPFFQAGDLQTVMNNARICTASDKSFMPRAAIQMKIIKCSDYCEMSFTASKLVARFIKMHPGIVLGLPTGSTPVGMYGNLIRLYEKGGLSFRNVTSFNLDEYLGLEKGHENSFNSYMHRVFFRHIDIRTENVNIPNSAPEDPQRECKCYERKIALAGGIDLMVLGIGNNGHIGFNEPNTHFPVSTHLTRLNESTIEANSRFFSHIEDVPRYAITMGIGTIMQSKRIILLASGSAKAEAIEKALEGPVSPSLPGSILQFHHDVTVVVDSEAAALLTSI